MPPWLVTWVSCAVTRTAELPTYSEPLVVMTANWVEPFSTTWLMTRVFTTALGMGGSPSVFLRITEDETG